MALSKYSLETWAQAQELITTRPDIALETIAETIGVPFNTMYAYAKRKRWLAMRDMNDARKSTARLGQIIRDLAGQTTDVHEHTIAMVEALQNSYRIMITRDSEGHLHYQNMPPVWPNKPSNFDSLSLIEQERALLEIDLPRLQGFISDLLAVLKLKMDNITFISKIIKGSLPKIDPEFLDLSRRTSDYTVDILATDDSRSLTEALKFDLKQLNATNGA